MSAQGDNIYIFTTREKKHLIVNLERKGCQVVGCFRGHRYGYNFCDEHRWILPIPAEKCPDGFQVALLKYWNECGVHCVHTHTYVGQKLSVRDRATQFFKRMLRHG